jgi:hypothetical protein
MTYAYRLLPGGYVDETGVHRGVPPTEEDFQRVALLTMHRTLFARGPHLLTARNGEQDYCGGPGVCKWCDEKDK